MCCSVLQRVAACCSVSQKRTANLPEGLHVSCVAVCCNVLQCVAVCCSVLQCLAVSCSVLQCNMLQCVAVCLVKLTAILLEILPSHLFR